MASCWKIQYCFHSTTVRIAESCSKERGAACTNKAALVSTEKLVREHMASLQPKHRSSAGSLPCQWTCEEMYHRSTAYKERAVLGWTAERHHCSCITNVLDDPLLFAWTECHRILYSCHLFATNLKREQTEMFSSCPVLREEGTKLNLRSYAD